MARPLRIEFADALYHVCARGNARQTIFLRELDRARFLELLRQSTRRFDVAILAFVLMNNHFHLLTQTRHPNLARWMHWLLTSYTIAFNKRHGRSGHLFQGRYKSFLVEEGEYLLSLSRYIHLNPVRGLSLGRGNPTQRRHRLRAFKWSSYRGYAGLDHQFDFVQPETVFGQLGTSSKRPEILYRRFVEEGLLREIENPFAAVQWQVVLGRENFIRTVRDRMTNLFDREVPALRGLTRSVVESHDILARIATRHNIKPRDLLDRDGHGIKARNLAMWLIWESGDKSLREIGEMFGGLDYAAVGQRIRRVRAAHGRKETEHLFREMLNVKT